MSRTVVAEIEYRGTLGRRKILAGGFLVAAVLGLVPEANRIILDEAQQQGSASIEEAGAAPG